MDAKFQADTKIAESKRTFETRKAEYDGEVNSKLAQAELAYELNAARMKQKIRAEELEIDVIDRKKQIDIQEKEILRKEKDLIASVKRPAEAEAYKMEILAEAQRLNDLFLTTYMM